MTTTSLFKQQWYFRYDPLDKTHDSFRVIKLLPAPYSAPVECILSHERISALEDRYSALSYYWGKRASPRWIRLNGKPFMLQPNLFEALKAIRKEDKEIYLWADGICINQSDVTERNHQVGLMGDIYRKAKNVRMWLGPSADGSDIVLDYVERDGDRFRREKAGEKLEEIPDYEEQKKAFIEVFRIFHRRPYWGRAWIKQEIILAKELVVHCGTKFTDGFRLLILAHWYCFGLDNYGLSDEIANLSMHRINLQNGKREPLEILLKRYGQTGCTDARDRVFSILSIASDTQGLESAIADYSISTPALFFALLDFIRPKNLISLATTLHDILGVRRSQLLEYWEKIEVSELVEEGPPRTDSKIENLGLSFVWATKTTKMLLEKVKEVAPEYVERIKSSSGDDLTQICQSMKLESCFVNSCLLMDSDPQSVEELETQELKKEDLTFFRISATNLYIMARKTLLGLRFVHIFIKEEDASSETGSKFEPINPNLSSEQLKPFMIYPQIVLRKKSVFSAQPDISNTINKWIIRRTYGVEAVEPGVEIVCCILLELDRLSEGRGICINDCRYVLEAYGHELRPLGNQLAQFRIQAEHERDEREGPRRRFKQ